MLKEEYTKCIQTGNWIISQRAGIWRLGWNRIATCWTSLIEYSQPPTIIPWIIVINCREFLRFFFFSGLSNLWSSYNWILFVRIELVILYVYSMIGLSLQESNTSRVLKTSWSTELSSFDLMADDKKGRFLFQWDLCFALERGSVRVLAIA